MPQERMGLPEIETTMTDLVGQVRRFGKANEVLEQSAAELAEARIRVLQAGDESRESVERAASQLTEARDHLATTSGQVLDEAARLMEAFQRVEPAVLREQLAELSLTVVREFEDLRPSLDELRAGASGLYQTGQVNHEEVRRSFADQAEEFADFRQRLGQRLHEQHSALLAAFDGLAPTLAELRAALDALAAAEKAHSAALDDRLLRQDETLAEIDAKLEAARGRQQAAQSRLDALAGEVGALRETSDQSLHSAMSCESVVQAALPGLASTLQRMSDDSASRLRQESDRALRILMLFLGFLSMLAIGAVAYVRFVS